MVKKYLEDEKISLYLFLAVWIVFTVMNMTKNCYNAAMAALVSEQVLTKSQTGAIGAMFYLVYAAFQFVGGFAVERFSPAKLVLVGIVGALFANLAICIRQDYMFMMTVWCLNGAVQFGIFPGLFKIISTQLLKEHRQKALFYFTLTTPGGFFLSYICAALVSRWQMNFVISVAALLVCAVGWFLTYRMAEKKMVEERVVPVVTEQAQKPRVNLFKLMLGSGLFILWVVILIETVFNQGIRALTPVMLMESYDHLSPSLATGLNTIMVGMGILGTFVGRRLLLRYIRNEAVSMLVLFACTFPLLVVLSFIGVWPVAVMLITLSLISATMSMAYMINSYISARFAPYGYVGTASGIVNASPSLGIFISNFLFTRIADGYGWTVTTRIFVVMAVAAVVLSAVSVPLWKKMVRE
ncbi:MAG: MFS transporter [Clostridia bacterium]|nr:MFS transporter [Clostridia bacterium]